MVLLLKTLVETMANSLTNGLAKFAMDSSMCQYH
jgi:hypothetical protein